MIPAANFVRYEIAEPSSVALLLGIALPPQHTCDLEFELHMASLCAQQ